MNDEYDMFQSRTLVTYSCHNRTSILRLRLISHVRILVSLSVMQVQFFLPK